MAVIDDINGMIDQLPDDPTTPPQVDPGTVGGRLAMGTRDVAQGFAQGLPGMLYDAAGNLINLPIRGFGALTGADVSPYLVRPAATNVDRALDAAGLPQEGTPNAAGRIIRGTAAGVSSVPLGMGIAGAAPALSTAGTVGSALAATPVAQAVGGAAGGASSIVTDQMRASNPTLASFIDAATSLAAAGSTAGLANLLNAPGLAPDVAAWAAKARDIYKIPVTAADISQQPAMRVAASVNRNLPWSGAGAADQAVSDAVTRGISRTIGEDTTRVNSGVMSSARGRIGDELDRIGGATTVQADDPLINDLAQISSDAPLALQPGELQPINNQIDNLQNIFAAHNGTVPGSVYQNLTKKGTPLNTVANNDNPNIALYGQRIQDALFDAWERSAPPDEVQNLQNARVQYKNMKTIEPLVEKSPTGELNPRLLPGAVQRNFDDLAYSGAGPLGDLANISSLFLKPPADSQTAMRSFVTGLIAHPASILGTLGGVLPANRALGAGLRSDWLTNYYLRGAGAGAGLSPQLGAGAAGFVEGQQQQPPGPYDDLRSLLR